MDAPIDQEKKKTLQEALEDIPPEERVNAMLTSFALVIGYAIHQYTEKHCNCK
jgi:hypothetical protein